MPFIGSNNAITYFRHALALDERRAKFIPTLHSSSRKPEEADSEVLKYESKINDLDTPTDVKEVFFVGAHCGTLPIFQRIADTLLTGVPSDVGGGAVKNGERHSLARIPLRWMVKECFDANTGIIFDSHMLKHQIGLVMDNKDKYPEYSTCECKELEPPSSATDGPTESKSDNRASWGRRLASPFKWAWGQLTSHTPKATSNTTPDVTPTDTSKDIFDQKRFTFEGSNQEELHDVLSKIHDGLKSQPAWWITEYWPCELFPSPRPFASMTTGLKGGWGRNPSSWMIERAPGSKGSCKSLVVYHWCRAVSLTVLTVSWNRGKGRIAYHKVNIHQSVKTRIEHLENTKEPYWPRIQFLINKKVRQLTRDEWFAGTSNYIDWVK